ncbi:SIMPL domain-containing protein [Pontivivens insulae]|uniref:26 kDa periplasmic immunogenic protein n=1 Tax=Pontivivens insulae TaxID=1639689 RepID=A0A2R8A9C9_9RHOB|nr:SIMPL domain-containing protein [Pontivivens insulae]RED18740.1 hypothetical protein DFR53_0939 [Pontivivens insulae]SPF28638.1 26 kDa periplasmic immunogenic protein [Pontivivens insulae]
MRIAILFLLAGLSAAPALAQEPPARTVTVSGSGSVAAAPDLATINVGVVEQAASASDALRLNNGAMTALFNVLDAAEIDGADRQTQGISLQPVYDNRSSVGGEGPRIVAYSASNALTIRVRDLRVLGKVLDDLAQAGANRINGISFGIAETEALMNEARQLAVEDAMARAALYVETAGATLGPVITINEQGGFGGPRPEMMAMSRMADNVPVAAGEVGISAQVSIVFGIE